VRKSRRRAAGLADMSDEEIIGILKMIQEQLNRMEARQVSVKETIEQTAPPVQGSFASVNQ
jgi:hypothetical protein